MAVTNAVLRGAASRIGSKQHPVSLCCANLAFSSSIMVQPYNSTEMDTAWKNSYFIYQRDQISI